MLTVLKYASLALLVLIVGGTLLIAIAPRLLDRIYYSGPASDHFNGERFFNPGNDDDTVPRPAGSSRGGRIGFFWRQLTSSDGRPPWPERVSVIPSKPAARVQGNRMIATWVGHATVLVQTNGLNILTDPIWSERASPLGFLGPKRVAAPGVRFEDLPPIDLVLVSHNHYDHLDLNTLRRLWQRDKPQILTSLGNDRVIGQAGAKAVALDWGQRHELRPGIEVIISRNHHWGSRWFADRNRALWSSFVVTLPGGNLFFAGDTGMGDGQWPFEAARHGPIRLALIPIGAFRFQPGQMTSGTHIGPADAAEVFRRLGASSAIPIHWGTFRLSFEAYDTPPRLLAEAMRETEQTGFAPVAIGGAFQVPAYTARPTRAGVPREELLRRLDTEAVRAMR